MVLPPVVTFGVVIIGSRGGVVVLPPVVTFGVVIIGGRGEWWYSPLSSQSVLARGPSISGTGMCGTQPVTGARGQPCTGASWRPAWSLPHAANLRVAATRLQQSEAWLSLFPLCSKFFLVWKTNFYWKIFPCETKIWKNTNMSLAKF